MTIYAKDYGVWAGANPDATRTGLQAALNAANAAYVAGGSRVLQDVILPAGDLRVTPYALTETCIVMRSGINLRGDAGGTTRLIAVGDLTDGTIGDDMALLRFGEANVPVSRINVRELELSMEEVTLADTNQQVHLWLAQAQTTNGDVTDLQAHDVIFGDTPARWVTLVGNSPYRVRNTLFNACRFRDAGQSGFIVQRGCTNTTIQDFEMVRFTDQAIDVEVSDSGSHNAVGLYILGKGKGSRSIIDRRLGRNTTGPVQGMTAIAFAGQLASALTDVVLQDVDVIGGRILSLVTDQMVFRNVTLGGDVDTTSGSGTLQFERRNTDILLENVVAERRAEASGGRVLNIFGVGSEQPSNFTVRDCRFTQYGSDTVESDIVRTHCVDNFTMENTTLVYDSPNPGRYAVWDRSVGQTPTNQVFRNVTITAKKGGLISGYLFSTSLAMGNILVSENSFTGCTKDVTFSGAQSLFPGPQYVYGLDTDRIDMTSTPAPVIHLAGIKDTTVTTTMSEASPEGVVSAIVGSTHINQTTAEVYEKTSGTGTTGWTL